MAPNRTLVLLANEMLESQGPPFLLLYHEVLFLIASKVHAGKEPADPAALPGTLIAAQWYKAH